MIKMIKENCINDYFERVFQIIAQLVFGNSIDKILAQLILARSLLIKSNITWNNLLVAKKYLLNQIKSFKRLSLSWRRSQLEQSRLSSSQKRLKISTNICSGIILLWFMFLKLLKCRFSLWCLVCTRKSLNIKFLCFFVHEKGNLEIQYK